MIDETVQWYALSVHAYCEMDNHYHLVLTTEHANLSRAVRHLNGVYAQWWNRRHKRTGHVFQARFHAHVVERDEYFLEVCRYVVLNPVRANLVLRPEEWAWSSYRATVGLAQPPPFLRDDELLARFGFPAAAGARDAYRSFVESAHASAPGAALFRPPKAVVGKPEFVESVLRGRGVSREVPIAQRQQARPTLEKLFRGGARRASRLDAIVNAHACHDYSVREIADYLGLHYTTVSRNIAKVRRRGPAGPDRAKRYK